MSPRGSVAESRIGSSDKRDETLAFPERTQGNVDGDAAARRSFQASSIFVFYLLAFIAKT